MRNRNSGEHTVKSTATTFQIAELLRKQRGATIKWLADELDLAKSTVYNHLATLEDQGFVVQQGDTYDLGLRFLQLGSYVQYRDDMYAQVEPKVQEIAEETGERCHFVVEEHGLGVCLFTYTGEHAVSVQPDIGQQIYLHSSASGKAILAHLPEEMVESVIDRWGLPPVTDRTITDRETLDDKLAEIRETGVAYNDGENISRTRALGVPISAPDDRVIGAISIQGPAHRLDGSWFEEDVQDLLLGTANELELNIAHGH